MALTRLFLKNLHGRIIPSSSSSFLSRNFAEQTLSNVQKQRYDKGYEFLRCLSTEAAGGGEVKCAEGKNVTVSGKKKSSLSPRRKRRWGLWKDNQDRDFHPALWGLGDALMQATNNINRLFQNSSPSQLLGRAKEEKECYKLRFNVPGLTKDDVKITVADKILTVKGEHKEEEDESDDEFWSSRSYYYNTSLSIPDDAKIDEIKAEMKDGVLYINIPRTENSEKDVKEIQVS